MKKTKKAQRPKVFTTSIIPPRETSVGDLIWLLAEIEKAAPLKGEERSQVWGRIAGVIDQWESIPVEKAADILSRLGEGRTRQ